MHQHVQTPTSARPIHSDPRAPRQFDWFVGLLYAIGAIGFAAVVLLFILIFNGSAG